MTLDPGARLGPYEITAKLGEGGMGVVYRARDFNLGREVALKVLPEGLTQDPDRTARFEREARLLASLNHPNIAQVHGLEIQDDMRALVLELVEGPTLAERLESGPLPLDQILLLGRQITAALEEAHEKGIVHRDLKPQNIKAPIDGTLKVLDFGLAKAIESADPTAQSADFAHSPTVTFGGTREGVILGTAAYMAPEQARGGTVDKRADIWAFGVVVYEMLTGERLFAEGSVVDTLSAVMRKPVDLDRLPASTPPRLRRLIARCLERDPKRRLRDIGEARIALEDLGAGVDEEPATAVESIAMRPDRRARRGAALAVDIAVAAALVAVALAGWLHRAAPAAAEPIRVHPLTYSGSDSDPAASPDGRLIAFTSRRDGSSRIWIKQLLGGGEAPLTAGPDGLARFSPDGSSLLFVRDLGSSQAIYRIGLIGGEPRRLVENATAADWSPDGRRVVFVRTRDKGRVVAQIGALEVATGQEKILVDLGDQLLHSPRWSPDGRTIAFTSGTFSSADWKLQTVDVATGRVSPVPPGKPESAMGGIAWSGAGEALFYVQSPGVMGDIAGSGSRVVRCELSSGERRTLFWRDGLSWLNSSVGEISQLDVLVPGRLLLGQRLRSQNLREVDLGAHASPSTSRLLATGSSIDRQPTYSLDGGQVFFSSNRGGNLDLWTIDRRTRVLRQVTDDPDQDWDPAYMPGGRQIVWSSNRESGHLEIWLANTDGSGARRVSNDGVSAQNPEPTPDGKWIVYWSGNPAKLGLWKVHPDGTGATLLERAVAPALSGVSPDGRYADWVEQDRLNFRNTVHVLEVDSGRVLPFEIDVQYTLGAPAVLWGRTRWSPDGRSLYVLGENEQGLAGIYEQRFDPDHDTRATRRPVAGFSPEYVTESFGVSPDGSRLTLSTGQETAEILVAEGVPGAAPPVRSER